MRFIKHIYDLYAVSYTHLDVYKRQIETWASCVTADNFLAQLQFYFTWKCYNTRRTPVSYTHLDVYKRQVHTRRAKPSFYIMVEVKFHSCTKHFFSSSSLISLHVHFTTVLQYLNLVSPYSYSVHFDVFIVSCMLCTKEVEIILIL